MFGGHMKKISLLFILVSASVVGISVVTVQFGGESKSLFTFFKKSEEHINSDQNEEVIEKSPIVEPKYSREEVRTINAIFSDKIPLIESALAAYYSYGKVSGLELLTKEALLSETIKNIYVLKDKEDIINSQLSNSVDYTKFRKYIEDLPQLEKELKSIRENL